MLSHAITMAVLTHPLHVLLVGVILSRLMREGAVAATWAWRARRSSTHSGLPVADPSDLRAA
jgi:hypothetical protein